jgi:hypothetical protein
MYPQQFWDKVAEEERNRTVEMVHMAPIESPTFNRTNLYACIDGIDEMSTGDLRKFIDRYFNDILNGIFYNPNGVVSINKYVSCFTNIKFLDAFIDVITTRKYFDDYIIIYINNICYDFMTSNHSNNESVRIRILRIANIVNAPKIPLLTSLGLTEKLASLLLIARRSTTNTNVYVRRVNFVIATQPPELMNDKMIAEIFNILYDVVLEWPMVFPCIMYDVDQYNENDPSTYWITEDVEMVESNIALAALTILNNQTIQRIMETLYDYSNGYYISNSNKPIRFSMRSLSDDFSSINIAVANLKAQGVDVP